MPLFVSFPPHATELLRLFAARPRTAIAIMQFVFGTVMPATRAFERGEDEKGLETFLLGVLGKQTLAQLSEESAQRSRDNISTLRALMLHDIGFPPLKDADVRGVRVPVLLVTGVRSPAVLLRLTDRLKEIINRGGEKISPREVDEVILDHPDVAQVVTFSMPHEKLGEDVAAAVVLTDGATLAEKELQNFVAERLADFKVPRIILFVDEIPKGATGKLARIGLAEKLGLSG